MTKENLSYSGRPTMPSTTTGGIEGKKKSYACICKKKALKISVDVCASTNDHFGDEAEYGAEPGDVGDPLELGEVGE